MTNVSEGDVISGNAAYMYLGGLDLACWRIGDIPSEKLNKPLNKLTETYLARHIDRNRDIRIVVDEVVHLALNKC